MVAISKPRPRFKIPSQTDIAPVIVSNLPDNFVKYQKNDSPNKDGTVIFKHRDLPPVDSSPLIPDTIDMYFQNNKRKLEHKTPEQSVKKIKTDKLHIELTLHVRISSLEKMKFIEPVNTNLIMAILKSSDVDCTQKNKFMRNKYGNDISSQLQRYCKKFDKITNSVPVFYKKSSHRWGRVYAVGGLSLQCFKSKIRNTLLEDQWIDIDMQCAFFTILKNVCDDNNINCPCLTTMITDRDCILTKYMEIFKLPRSVIKTLFNSIGFGGTFSCWAKTNQVEQQIIPKYIQDLQDELYFISHKIKDANPELYRVAKARKSKNALHSCLALYTQEYELRIMEEIIDYMYKSDLLSTTENALPIIYGYDGINILRDSIQEYGIDKLIKELESYILTQTGFQIILKEKPIGDKYDIQPLRKSPKSKYKSKYNSKYNSKSTKQKDLSFNKFLEVFPWLED